MIISTFGFILFLGLVIVGLYSGYIRLRRQLGQVRMNSRRHEANFKAVIENLTDGVFILNDQGYIEFVNRAAEEIFGFSGADVEGRLFAGLLVADAQPMNQSCFDPGLQLGQTELTNFEGEIMGRRSDGSLVPLVLNLRHFEVGPELGQVAIVHNLSDRRHLEAQLCQAQKMEAIGHLTAGIAHDFNNMLTIISGQSELLLTELVTEAGAVRREIEEIHAICERAARLTRQLLIVSRRQPIQPYPLNLNSIVLNLDDMLRRLIGENVVFATRLAENLGAIQADPGQIEQIIVNLTVNAVDAMPHGGRLTIETANASSSEFHNQPPPFQPDTDLIRLSVSDTGVGMAAETLRHIFEPFFSAKKSGQGSGIGLATVDSIVRQSGGFIEVWSQPGQGATFHIYLPRVEAPIVIMEGEAEAKTTTLRGTETILLVEDEAAVRLITRRILERQGYRVLEADGAQAGLQIGGVSGGQIDMLLTDMIMPDMSGRELAGQLTRIHPQIKVLYISGYSDEALDRYGVMDTDVTLLEKPFTTDQLLSKVRDVLQTTP